MWRRTRSWIELRQAVKRLIGNAIGGPVLAHGSEVVIEATVFLGHEDDVVDALQAAVLGGRASR